MESNWIAQRALLTPNRIGLQYEEQTYTFLELYEQSSVIAKKLHTASIKQGDRIAILAPSCPELVQFIYACMQAQVEIVFLNNRLTALELAYQIDDAKVAAILVHEQLVSQLPADVKFYTFPMIQALQPAKILLSNEWDLQHTVSIMYTSGTTGFPKGVRQTLQNHQASAINSVLNIGMLPNDAWLCMVPIFHISGFSMLMKSILYGNKVVLYEKFDEEAAVTHLLDGSITHMSVVGVTLGRLLSKIEQLKTVAHPNVRLLLAGGSSIPADYLQRAQKLQLNVAQTYGMTETASQTATLSSEDAMRKIGSAGKPLFFNDVKIDGAKAACEEGEILIRGPHVTPGYIGRFEQKASTVNGWLPSGDIGYFDEDGYLYIVDRRSDLIISGGENIYPAQIENVLLMHPNVEEAGVCGVASERWGQVPVAFVVANDVTKDELIQLCQQHLANYKMPKQIQFVETLPRNGSNKLLRRKLHELYEAHDV
jgi:o-succinylbenzoate---CoA ligase